jgi:hypothetical protein
MKKLLVIAMFILTISTIGYTEHNYTRDNCVAVETTETGVIFEDRCGFTWYWEEEGFEVGDVVDLKMYDNYSSAYIDDDEIKKVVRK